MATKGARGSGPPLDEIYDQIDVLPSARRFLELFDKTEESVQFFSGEGESLILAAWLAHHRIFLPGVFVATLYGVQWRVHEEARRRFALLPQPWHNSQLKLVVYTPDGDSACLYSFLHGMYFEYRKGCVAAAMYQPDPRMAEVAELLRSSSVQNVVMGFRSDDVPRHLAQTETPADLSNVMALLDQAVNEHAGPVSKATYHVWWPLYDLDEDLKRTVISALDCVHGLFGALG